MSIETESRQNLIQASLMLPLWQQIIFEEFSFSYWEGCVILKLYAKEVTGFGFGSWCFLCLFNSHSGFDAMRKS